MSDSCGASYTETIICDSARPLPFCCEKESRFPVKPGVYKYLQPLKLVDGVFEAWAPGDKLQGLIQCSEDLSDAGENCPQWICIKGSGPAAAIAWPEGTTEADVAAVKADALCCFCLEEVDCCVDHEFPDCPETEGEGK